MLHFLVQPSLNPIILSKLGLTNSLSSNGCGVGKVPPFDRSYPLTTNEIFIPGVKIKNGAY